MPLLLHSLTFYADLIEEIARIAPDPSVVEVGSEHGHMSELLAELTASRDGHLYVVEPRPAPRLVSLAQAHRNVVVVEGLSPAALQDTPPAGLYLLDGDHNYAVVGRELKAIFDRPDAGSPIVVLHDVGWPWARRDLYYSPASLAPEDVKAHSWTRGVSLGQAQLARRGHGFRGMGAFAAALEEGGPRNGVLTALEDFLAGRPELEMLTTPLVFGLAVVGHKADPSWSRIVEAMRPYTTNPTLEEMERNRLELFLAVVEQSDRGVRARVKRCLRIGQLPLASR